MTQKSNETLVRKMPLPIDIDVVEGTTFSDGLHTLTSRETSHIKIVSIDSDNFLKYELSPPKRTTTKSLKEYLGEDQLLGTDDTVVAKDGRVLGQYKYFKRADCSYYVTITGEHSSPHNIDLGKLVERTSPISSMARAIAYKFDTRQFSRRELLEVLPEYNNYGQKLKALLSVLHLEGFLAKAVIPKERGKAKELYTATEKLKKYVIPSPSPEQA